MAFRVGEQAWMVVHGDPKDGAGLHMVEIAALKEDGKKVVVTREAGHGMDCCVGMGAAPEFGDGFEEKAELHPRDFAAISEADDIQLNADESVTELGRKPGEILSAFDVDSNPQGEGNGTATLFRYDPQFAAENPEGVNDMVKLTQLNNAELGRNLKSKFNARIGYVRCGPTLVALNMMRPFKTPTFPDGPFSKNLYPEFFEMVDREKASPHPWSLASHCNQQAFWPMSPTHKHNNQAMIITGESGAGKTYTTKQILDYLAWVGSDRGQNKELQALTDKMLSTTPILEGLGNANMPRNPDSSRFGKLYKIFLDSNTRLMTGCGITPYMLEKSRVSEHQQGERNFHMFYRMLCEPVEVHEFRKVAEKAKKSDADAEKELLELRGDCTVKPGSVSCEGKSTIFEEGGKEYFGLPQAKRDMCFLGPAGGFEKYVYLRGGTHKTKLDYPRIYRGYWGENDPRTDHPDKARTFDDAFHMSHMMAAFHGFFTEEEIDMILKTIAGCLHLGNVNINRKDKNDLDTSNPVDMTGESGQALKYAAELWQVDINLLKDACCKVTFQVGGGKTKQDFISGALGGADGAISLRDAVARFVYNELFLWVVRKCSETLQNNPNCRPDPDKPGAQRFLGVLDIFGFEFYDAHQIVSVGCQVVNGLDQLNINICNERLQKVFVDVIFGLEQAGYDAQGVSFSFDDYEDNEPAIRFLMDKSGPLIKSLGDPGRNRKTGVEADVMFLTNMTAAAKKGKFLPPQGKNGESERDKINAKEHVMLQFPDKPFSKPFKGIDGGPYGCYGDKGRNGATWKANANDINATHNGKSPAFGIRHYAAEVAYDCRDWIQKDKAKPSEEMAEVLGKSQDMIFMQPTFSQEIDAEGGVTQQFSDSLEQLVKILDTCDINFVRCLKTSQPLAVGAFQSALVLKQLQYTGMLDTLNIRRFGFPSRLSPQAFLDEYALLAPNVTVPGYGDDCKPPSFDKVYECAKAVADHMHKTYCEEVFAELPESDRVKKFRIEQKKQTIAVGKHAKVEESVVMMRDWFQRGCQKRAFEHKMHFADIVSVSMQKKYFSEDYKTKAESMKNIGPMLRALAMRPKYLETKWNTLDELGKTRLYEKLRAHSARMQYTEDRNKKYEEKKRLGLQIMILSTLHRQRYYEHKMKFLESEMSDAENRKMRAQDNTSAAFMKELLEEREIQAERRRRMLKEEEHADEIMQAIEMAKGNLIKERAMLMASWHRQKAVAALQRVKQIEIDADKQEAMLRKHKKAIEAALLQKCLQRLKAMNLITGKTILVNQTLIDQKLELEEDKLQHQGMTSEQIEAQLIPIRENMEQEERQRQVDAKHGKLLNIPKDHEKDELKRYFSRNIGGKRRQTGDDVAEVSTVIQGNLDIANFDSQMETKVAAALVNNLKGLGVKGLDLQQVQVALSSDGAPNPTPRINSARPYPEGGFGKPYIKM